jgi:hypothetical protein
MGVAARKNQYSKIKKHGDLSFIELGLSLSSSMNLITDLSPEEEKFRKAA